MALWRESLSQLNEKAGQSLADPKDYENLFPGYVEALKAEQFLKSERQQLVPASEYSDITVSTVNNGELLSVKWLNKFLNWQLQSNFFSRNTAQNIKLINSTHLELCTVSLKGKNMG